MTDTTITKYGHACLILEKNNQKLVIDPGCFTKLPEDLTRITGLIITEEHVDHLDFENIKRILAASPDVSIYTTTAAAKKLSEENIVSAAVSGDQDIAVSGYIVTFYETDHAVSYAVSSCKSLAIKISDVLYYPSDTYRVITDTVRTLALPTSGPWHKISEAVDFANSIKSERILVTHNGLYNNDGNSVANHFISMNLSQKDREFIFLEPGQSI